MQWTDEEIEQLKAYWAEAMSSTQIKDRIPGKSRNAIIGKAHRLGLPIHPKSHNRRTEPRRPMQSSETRLWPHRKPPQPVDVSPPRADDPRKNRTAWIPFMEANIRTCRAVMGRSKVDGLQMWCPNPKHPTMSWCPYHARIYYREA